MYLYFLLIRIAALFGHKKARALVRGQKETIARLQRDVPVEEERPIWIHAASVGEFEQARTLIERLKANGERRKIIVTFFSPSGYELRKDFPMVDGVYYLPFATRRNARRFIDALQPSMAIFVKYEFWPAYIRELKKRDIPTYSICSIFRPKQFFFRFWGKRHLRVLKRFTHLFVQDEASRRLLAEHGVHQASVSGDTRFDRVIDVMGKGEGLMANDITPILHFVEGCERVIIAGSTWPEDEVLLAKYIGHLSLDIGHLSSDIGHCSTKLILVPHETNEEHLHFIFNLFQGRYVKYSAVTGDGLQVTGMSRTNILHRANVMVIDSVGMLSSIYRYGQVAYIGGGFGAGIHNTIEAAVYGLPVVFGPNYHHFREAQGLIDAGAGRSVSNEQELEEALETALEQHETIGAKAAEYVQSELGATTKIYNEIFDN